MAPTHRSHAWFAAVLGAVLVSGLLFTGCGDDDGGTGTTLPEPTSRYENTRPGVGYVGRQVCEGCHADMHDSYLHTSHSRAFAKVDAGKEPRGGSFRHKASGLQYRVRNSGSVLTMAEVLGFRDGSEVVLAQHDMRYVAGSGTNSRSYVLPLEGFMVESPVTWYSKRRKWDLSPGYDRPEHESFSRPIEQACVFCHVGRTEMVGGSSQRLRIDEDAIGCERCHGPGELHVQKWEGREATGERDWTIVNPVDLPPAAQTDLCGQCHLDHTLSVEVRSRSMDDWRPGLPMEAFRTTYAVDKATSRMSVVGHVDQMERSRCFQASGTMTCLTCHDPHQTPSKAERDAWFRGKCLECHDVSACGVEHTDPRRKKAADDCIGCHMPKSDTDIPHFSFTHHRVGIHAPGDETYPPPETIQTLVPTNPIDHLPAADQARNLGIAYLLLAVRRPEDPEATDVPQSVIDVYWERAREALERARAGGASDGVVESSLAYVLHMQQGDAEAVKSLCRAALARGAALTPMARVRALDVLGTAQLASGETKAAIGTFEQLTKLRRSAEDWGRLATAHSRLGSKGPALAAARKAVEIRPNKPEIQAFLAQAYRLNGNARKAAEHDRIAKRLREVARR